MGTLDVFDVYERDGELITDMHRVSLPVDPETRLEDDWIDLTLLQHNLWPSGGRVVPVLDPRDPFWLVQWFELGKPRNLFAVRES